MRPRRSEADEAFAKRLGANIARARRARGISQSQFCERSGFHRTTISVWETGKRIPSVDSFARIMRALDASAEELLEGIDG